MVDFDDGLTHIHTRSRSYYLSYPTPLSYSSVSYQPSIGSSPCFLLRADTTSVDESLSRFISQQEYAAEFKRLMYSNHFDLTLVNGECCAMLSQSAASLEQSNNFTNLRGQIAAEVKGIYSGLTLVDNKCSPVLSQSAVGTKQSNEGARIGAGRLDALIALHRTLLHEHHDFFLASQHPSAGRDIIEVADQDMLPARMWKHGMHIFLELLRHHLPGSLDYMLAFVLLAYQMMVLLFEAVLTHEDTWIQCLKDLGHYRKAVEDAIVFVSHVWAGEVSFGLDRSADHIDDARHPLGLVNVMISNSLFRLSRYCRSLTAARSFVSSHTFVTAFFFSRQIPGDFRQVESDCLRTTRPEHDPLRKVFCSPAKRFQSSSLDANEMFSQSPPCSNRWADCAAWPTHEATSEPSWTPAENSVGFDTIQKLVSCWQQLITIAISTTRAGKPPVRVKIPRPNVLAHGAFLRTMPILIIMLALAAPTSALPQSSTNPTQRTTWSWSSGPAMLSAILSSLGIGMGAAIGGLVLFIKRLFPDIAVVFCVLLAATTLTWLAVESERPPSTQVRQTLHRTTDLSLLIAVCFFAIGFATSHYIRLARAHSRHKRPTITNARVDVLRPQDQYVLRTVVCILLGCGSLVATFREGLTPHITLSWAPTIVSGSILLHATYYGRECPVDVEVG